MRFSIAVAPYNPHLWFGSLLGLRLRFVMSLLFIFAPRFTSSHMSALPPSFPKTDIILHRYVLLFRSVCSCTPAKSCSVSFLNVVISVLRNLYSTSDSLFSIWLDSKRGATTYPTVLQNRVEDGCLGFPDLLQQPSNGLQCMYLRSMQTRGRQLVLLSGPINLSTQRGFFRSGDLLEGRFGP